MYDKSTTILKFIKKNKWFPYFIIILIGAILSIPLSQIQIRECHDGKFHFLRILGTIDTLKLGQFPPFINPNFCNGSGYAMNLFYPPLVTYLPMLVKLFTQNYMTSLKIFGGICIVLSGITMYQFVYEVTKKREIAVFAAIFYLVAPYKLANVYKRFAIGEFTAMIFIPFVFLGLFNLIEGNQKKHYYIAIGFIGLVLSHTVTTLYIAIFCLFYLLCHFQKLKNIKIIQKGILNGIFILLITALFWLPLLEATSLAEYTIMDDITMRTNADFATENTISLSQLFKDKGETNGTTFLLGFPTTFILLFTIFTIKKINKPYKSFYLLSIIFSFLCIFMASRLFPWKYIPNIFCKLQFPWRMIGYFNFFASFICGVNLFMLLKQIRKKAILKIGLVFIFVIAMVYNSLSIMKQFYAVDKERDKRYENYILSNRKISHMQINRDYMPLKALKLQNTYVMEREDRTYILEGNAYIIKENKVNLKDEIKLQKVQESTLLEFPYYYYPGYKITLIANGIEKEIKPIESEHGYLSCYIEQKIEEGSIIIEYVGSTITYASYGISAISLVFFIFYIVIKRKKEF